MEITDPKYIWNIDEHGSEDMPKVKAESEYGKQLIYHLHAAEQLDKLNLILMDSHYSHVFNYCYMKMMFDKDIKVMALEAHSSHFSQPLDKNPFSAFKNEFNFQMKRFD